MNTAIKHPAVSVNYKTGSNKSAWKRFITWANNEEENRFFWLAVGIVGHGCVFTIATILVVLFTGNNFIFWPFAIAAMTMTVVSNLAAMPTRITIPIFFLSLLIDIAVIVLSVAGMQGHIG